LIDALVPGVQQCRELVRALAARAMLRLSQGRYDEAWQDLLACHRLGRLVASGGTIIEGLFGIAIEHLVSYVDLVYLDRARVDAKKFKECLYDLQTLPPLPAISALAEKVDLVERFMCLDTAMRVDRHGFQYLAVVAGGLLAELPHPPPQDLLDQVDWDPVLRSVNRWLDRLVAALRVKDRGTRKQQLDQLDDELMKIREKITEDLPKVFKDEKSSARTLGKLISDILITQLVPRICKVQIALDRTEQLQRNLHVAVALAAYQREHGRYPAKLEELAPKYLPQIPQDLFSGKALIYRPSKDGYLLYSVGINGIDEGGRYYDDDPPGDDPNVRMPRSRPKEE
jgi:hypothetical protein